MGDQVSNFLTRSSPVTLYSTRLCENRSLEKSGKYRADFVSYYLNSALNWDVFLTNKDKICIVKSGKYSRRKGRKTSDDNQNKSHFLVREKKEVASKSKLLGKLVLS